MLKAGRNPRSSGPVINRLKDITVDLPDELPREVQVFLLLLLVRKWSDASTS
jgi:hypothetical protein